jgi:hypothetical protein
MAPPFFLCRRTDLEYPSRRWCGAAYFPSHAGNRHNTGPPTEACEDLLTSMKEAEKLNQSQPVIGSLRSQVVTFSSGSGGHRYAPYAFTEHGVI